MKIVSVNVPEAYLKALEEKLPVGCMNRSETIRLAVREFLIREMRSSGTLPNPEFLSSESQKNENIKFYECCINCGRLISFSARENHFFHKNIEIFKLQFCCSCYSQFKDKSFDDFPVDLIDKIQKNIKVYKEQDRKDYLKEQK